MSKLKSYHKLLALFSIHICIWIFLVHGWMGYAVITHREGFRYEIFIFYHITRTQYYIYQFTVAFIALQLIAFQVYYLVEKKPKHLIFSYLGVIILGMLIFLIELFFESRFTPKG